MRPPVSESRHGTDLPLTADVVVLGGGLAGHCAALSAAEQGASVLLLEKTGRVGGSSILSSGTFAFANTDEQTTAGIQDSDEQLESDIMAASGNIADPVLVKLYVARQREIHAWLKQQGVRFDALALSSNMSVPRSHPTNPVHMMGVLHERLRANERITFRAYARALELRRDPGGEVCAVRVVAGAQQPVDVGAGGGVVLATGGFSRNTQLIAKFAPRMAVAMATGGAGNTGDGLLMAWALGADLVDMPFINGTFGMSVPYPPDGDRVPRGDPLLMLPIYKGAIAVNLHARRFADESVSYKTLGEFCLGQPEGMAFQIFDQKIMDKSSPTPTAQDVKGAYEKGWVYAASSIEGLARAVRIDASTLVRTVAAYNESAASGREQEFGRASLGKGYGQISAIDMPPFYIYPCTTAVLSTYCGVRVGTDMHVIDVWGKPIQGLFAAGEMVGGLHGAGYMSGSALAKAAIFGRIAGVQAAARATAR